MNVKILKQGENHLELEIKGEDHTLCNLLKKALLKNKDVVFAGYKIEHPLLSEPHLYISTNGNVSPKEVMTNTVVRLKSLLNEFKEHFSKAVEDFRKS